MHGAPPVQLTGTVRPRIHLLLIPQKRAPQNHPNRQPQHQHQQHQQQRRSQLRANTRHHVLAMATATVQEARTAAQDAPHTISSRPIASTLFVPTVGPLLHPSGVAIVEATPFVTPVGSTTSYIMCIGLSP
ncbi:hypothetical protein BC939DRAFT_459123 [Gamsiella multidivaricata]|uniref:uncharacterized protein n=1 Tax=Gamsiella multidivaricata TaxID=101098 RepID=UPI00222098BA|nr:uncharacterized protein BC939DRAFT_459123 [Gamsiella multidivaricata]KAI7819966.1 hypothetical protein BC939DRAFT_459123 [Gamsiella multidivaricata]